MPDLTALAGQFQPPITPILLPIFTSHDRELLWRFQVLKVLRFSPSNAKDSRNFGEMR